RNPLMRNAIRTAIIIGGDNLILKQCVQGEAICLGLRIRIVIFAFFADSPAIFAIVALSPPAVEDTAIGLPIERRLLAAGAAGFMRSNRVVQPEVGARHQVASHVYVVVFQENDFTTECITARD